MGKTTCFSDQIWEAKFLASLFGDFGLVATAIVFIFIYANLVLGTCSPIHFRVVSRLKITARQAINGVLLGTRVYPRKF